MLENIADMAPDDEWRKRCLEWFAFMECSVVCWPFGGMVHLRPHWARVLVLATKIAVREGLSLADWEALAMASAFHDTRRRDSGVEEGHGDRAAEHYRDFCSKSGMRFDPRAYIAIRWHDRDDSCGMEAARSWDVASDPDPNWKASAVDVLRIFKDSDGLDRMRLREEALDLSYLRSDYSRSLKPFALELIRASKDQGAFDPPDGVPRFLPYLVVVDVQEDTVAAMGESAASIAREISGLAGSFDGRVVFTKEISDPIMSDRSSGTRCVACTEGWMLACGMEETRRAIGSAVYLKGPIGSFDLAFDLEAAYARGNLGSVEIVGVGASSAVVSVACMIRSQVPQEVSVYVRRSLCADRDSSSAESAMHVMGECGIEIR